MVKNLRSVFEFEDDIMLCPKGIDISRQYEFGLDYVHESGNDSTRRVQKIDMNPIKCIQCNNRV